jgi:hypothetical protein
MASDHVDSLSSCIGPSARNRPGPQWILGDTFMRQWYTVFNYVDETVGFAKAVHS